MQSFDELHSFLRSVLVVALSEDVGCIDGISVPAEMCLQSANNCIKGVHVEDCNSKDIIELNDFSCEEDTPLSWRKWSDDLYATANTLALRSNNGNIVNAFYNPTAAKKLKTLIQDLPLWTGIMRPYFKCGTEVSTSSSVESLFAEYKTRLFKGCIPMRVDKFVASHLDYLDGRLRLDYAANAFSTQQECKTSAKDNKMDMHESDNEQYSDFSMPFQCNLQFNSTPISNNDNSIANSSHLKSLADSSCDIETIKSSPCSISDTLNPLNFQEKGMGLINKNNKKCNDIKKKSYLDKCPEWDSIESVNAVFIPVMKNGNLCQPVKLQGKTIMIRNTCAFDALLHISAHMIGVDAQYKQVIHDTDDRLMQLASKIVSGGKITKNEYTERAYILTNLSLFQECKYNRRFHSLDAMCNAAHLAEYTFVSFPSLHRKKTCTNCKYSNEKSYTAISINVDIVLNQGFQHIQDVIEDIIRHNKTSKQTCIQCYNLCDITETYGPHIIIDTSILSDKNYLKNTKLETKTYN
ncbi:hypothetical protein X777_08658 [Ooceraea biroi]|uniref:NOF-FB transposable element protein n=1 Tax=Ooceraea biroi TaxID=2015173 RepID=A0A026W937_OOCBI|nr:hypothetical protein X777_08658 [Ooceraea biroi]